MAPFSTLEWSLGRAGGARLIHGRLRGEFGGTRRRLTDVRYWHLADIPEPPTNVRFRG